MIPYIKESAMFKDPSSNSVQKLTKCATVKDVIELTMSLHPSWIDSMHKRFSNDYPSLSANWKEVCKKTNSRPSEIVLVNFLPLSDDADHQFILHVIDILTSTGFAVRRTSEFVTCSCGALIPSQHSHPYLKNKPLVWLPHCQKCPGFDRELSPPPTLVNRAMEALHNGWVKFK